jgi:multiple antibiotic resistance protein
LKESLSRPCLGAILPKGKIRKELPFFQSLTPVSHETALHNLTSAFVTLFVVVYPIGLAPLFLELTQDLPDTARRKIGGDACIIAFGVLAGAALVGNWLLTALGISLEAFRIAGGLLLFAIAFEMVFERRQKRKARHNTSPQGSASIAAFPLGIPLMAGPGAITACMLLAGEADGNWLELAILIGVIVTVMALCFAVFAAANVLQRFMGPRGVIIAGRLLGVLLAAMAVQFVADGIAALVRQH